MIIIVYIARENLAESDPLIIPYIVVNRRFISLYGIIIGPLSTNISCVRYSNFA